jgi:hypothetical protein
MVHNYKCRASLKTVQRVDCAAEHMGAWPYMTRWVRAEKAGYIEAQSVNAALQRRGTSALLTVQPDISMRQGAHYVDAWGEQQGGAPGWRIRIQLDN